VLALPIRHHWPYWLGVDLARVGSARGQGVTVTGVRVALGDNRKYLQRFALILEYVLHSEYSDQSGERPAVGCHGQSTSEVRQSGPWQSRGHAVFPLRM
jgi:hypothetical protein